MAKSKKSGKQKASRKTVTKDTPQLKVEKPVEAVVEAAPSSKRKITIASLHKWNIWLAAIHAVQGLAIIALSSTNTLPVQTSFLSLDPIASQLAGHPVLATATRHLFDVNLAYLVAAFFFMSALAHAVIATVGRNRYESDLKRGVNLFRWVEYGVSASTMMVAIAFLSGVADLSTLIMIFVLDLIMNAMGLAMEVLNRGKPQPNWLTYWIGCIAGIVPWVVFAIYIWGANVYGSGNVPTFVYWIYLSIFVFFNAFAVNMYLQYKKKGAWADYLYGERAYMILSLVAKTALAWQVFAGTLRP